MRQYCFDCGAKNPISLRGTKLRQHIATKCIELNLTDNQVNILADHLGHHKDVHKQYYQKPISALEIVKVSKLLAAAAGQQEYNEKNDENFSESASESEQEDISSKDDENLGMYHKILHFFFNN